MTSLINAIQQRRTYYTLSAEAPISDAEIITLAETALKHTPSAFNMQSARLLVLLHQQHLKFWRELTEILRQVTPEEKFQSTQDKISAFSKAYGTILYFDDTSTVEKYAAQFSLYKENFPVWAAQANGMLQSNLWMLLEDAGFGASLQHYNPLVDDMVYQNWGVPKNWKLIAQMPFGKPVTEPGEKAFLPIQDRINVFS